MQPGPDLPDGSHGCGPPTGLSAAAAGAYPSDGCRCAHEHSLRYGLWCVRGYLLGGQDVHVPDQRGQCQHGGDGVSGPEHAVRVDVQHVAGHRRGQADGQVDPCGDVAAVTQLEDGDPGLARRNEEIHTRGPGTSGNRET